MREVKITRLPPGPENVHFQEHVWDKGTFGRMRVGDVNPPGEEPSRMTLLEEMAGSAMTLRDIINEDAE